MPVVVDSRALKHQYLALNALLSPHPPPPREQITKAPMKTPRLNYTMNESEEPVKAPLQIRCQKRKPATTAAHEKTHTLLQHPPWLYLHLELHGAATSTSSETPSLDALTARTHLTSALSQFLGLTGTAIPIDILHLRGREVWVRVPRGDGSAVVAAVGGWVGGGGGKEGVVGWRVRGRGQWLGGLVGGDGGDLFGD